MGDAPARILKALQNYLAGFRNETVRDFVAGLGWSMKRRALEPHALPCLRHLDRTAEIASADTQPLARLLAENRHQLYWGQTYRAEDFGARFLDNYGWVEVFGTRGHFAYDAIAGGFLLLGPNTEYPDHHHIAEEIYVPLTGGSLWRRGSGAFAGRAAGETIHHRSNVSHAMTTLREPLLALYLWRGGDLAQRSRIAAAANESGG